MCSTVGGACQLRGRVVVGGVTWGKGVICQGLVGGELQGCGGGGLVN